MARPYRGAAPRRAPRGGVLWAGEGQHPPPAADGDPAIGILLSDTAANDSGVSKAGTEVDVLIKDIGLALAGGAIKKGEHLTATTTGAVQKAAAGNFILGIAMTATTAAGELVQIQMTKSGYEKAASGGN